MGWICPRCGACYSPFVSGCSNCTGYVPVITTAGSASACHSCGHYPCRRTNTACPVIHPPQTFPLGGDA